MENCDNYDSNNINQTLKGKKYKEMENLYYVLNALIKRVDNVKEINGRDIFEKNKKIILLEGMMVKVWSKEEIVKFNQEYKEYDQLSDYD